MVIGNDAAKSYFDDSNYKSPPYTRSFLTFKQGDMVSERTLCAGVRRGKGPRGTGRADELSLRSPSERAQNEMDQPIEKCISPLEEIDAGASRYQQEGRRGQTPAFRLALTANLTLQRRRRRDEMRVGGLRIQSQSVACTTRVLLPDDARARGNGSPARSSCARW